ncbi:hypothetical protein AVEN_245037-1 [Araneus ventricosus]|uniref:Transmembrane protein n=1 Tax=Araneus ventricosus TaxID=182803 RepID=A0A4Y2E6L6_ARAVE|nr:hypothetical protein AVEN_245037-1 [Araneus ventricosus]
MSRIIVFRSKNPVCRLFVEEDKFSFRILVQFSIVDTESCQNPSFFLTTNIGEAQGPDDSPIIPLSTISLTRRSPFFFTRGRETSWISLDWWIVTCIYSMLCHIAAAVIRVRGGKKF